MFDIDALFLQLLVQWMFHTAEIHHPTLSHIELLLGLYDRVPAYYYATLKNNHWMNEDFLGHDAAKLIPCSMSENSVTDQVISMFTEWKFSHWTRTLLYSTVTKEYPH